MLIYLPSRYPFHSLSEDGKQIMMTGIGLHGDYVIRPYLLPSLLANGEEIIMTPITWYVDGEEIIMTAYNLHVDLFTFTLPL